VAGGELGGGRGGGGKGGKEGGFWGKSGVECLAFASLSLLQVFEGREGGSDWPHAFCFCVLRFRRKIENWRKKGRERERKE